VASASHFEKSGSSAWADWDLLDGTATTVVGLSKRPLASTSAACATAPPNRSIVRASASACNGGNVLPPVGAWVFRTQADALRCNHSGTSRLRDFGDGDVRLAGINRLPQDANEASTDCKTIYVPFVQLQRDAPDGYTGTGLGLSISRDLAYAMKGELSVKSEVGRGSAHTLRLPRSGAAM
jgi:hypothetical protein